MIKTLFIVILIGSISVVHLLYTESSIGFHVLHQQLFYVPLVLASFWFGIRAGLATAVASVFCTDPVRSVWWWPSSSACCRTGIAGNSRNY